MSMSFSLWFIRISYKLTVKCRRVLQVLSELISHHDISSF